MKRGRVNVWHVRLPVTMRLLHAPGGRSALAGSLRSQLLTRGFSSGGLTGGLLGTGHGFKRSPAEKKKNFRKSIINVVIVLCRSYLCYLCIIREKNLRHVTIKCVLHSHPDFRHYYYTIVIR